MMCKMWNLEKAPALISYVNVQVIKFYSSLLFGGMNAWPIYIMRSKGTADMNVLCKL